MKGWADYLLEALGLGWVAGCIALAGAVIFGNPSPAKGLLIGGLAFGAFAGLRLMVGRGSSATEKPGGGKP